MSCHGACSPVIFIKPRFTVFVVFTGSWSRLPSIFSLTCLYVFLLNRFFFWVVPVTVCAGAELLPPVVVDGKVEEPAVMGAGLMTTMGEDRLAEVPPGRGTFQDLLGGVAGAYVGSPGFGIINLRGLNQDSFFGNFGTASNPLLVVMEDGVPLSSTTLRYLPPLMWDLESATVLRGPQSLAGGPTALGGSLRLTTTSLGFAARGAALTEFSQEGGLRTGLSQQVVLVPDELALRFSYQHQQSDGYEDNVFYLDDEFGASDRDALKLSVRWHPGKNPDAQFVLSLVSDQLGGNPFANVIDHADRGLFVRETSLNTPSYYEADRQAVALTATLALPADMVLKSTFSLQRLDLESGFDLDVTPILGWFNAGYRDEQRLVEDVVLSRDVGRFAWQLGGYFESSEYTTGNSGQGLAPFPIGSAFDNEGVEKVVVAAAYARGDWEFADTFHLTGGVRLNHERRELEATSIFGLLPPASSLGETEESTLLPEAGLSWQPSVGREVGVRFARGYRGAGIGFAPTLGLTAPYEAEYSWDSELYASLAATDTLQLSAAVFHSSMDDMQVPANVPGGFPTIDTLVYNAATARRQGAEMEARWQPVDGLSLTGSVSWLDTQFQDLMLDGTDRADQAFPNAPEWTASFGINYRHASGVFASGMFSYADATYSQIGSPEATALETRKVLSARVGYAWGNASIYLFGSNLLDEDYALLRVDNSALGLPVVGKAAPPCLVGIGCELRW